PLGRPAHPASGRSSPPRRSRRPASNSSSVSAAVASAPSRKPRGSSRSAAAGSRSGRIQPPSPASPPSRARTPPHRAEASRSRPLGALTETERVVEVRRGGQQVRVHPDAVAGLDALAGSQGSPQRGGVPQPARSQLQPDEVGEGLLGGTTRGAPTAYGLLEL